MLKQLAEAGLFAQEKHMSNPHRVSGFTIVELLIVIVVISVLAAISIVAYNGAQQRAKNTAIISAASQSLKLIQSYIATNGDYPLKATNTTACITVQSGCHVDSANDTPTVAENTTLSANMASIGVSPKSVPTDGSRWYGVLYTYNSSAVVNGESRPAFLRYHLLGQNQQCGLPGSVNFASSNTYTSPGTGYYQSNSTLDKTFCYISIPGPAHS